MMAFSKTERLTLLCLDHWCSITSDSFLLSSLTRLVRIIVQKSSPFTIAISLSREVQLQPIWSCPCCSSGPLTFLFILIYSLTFLPVQRKHPLNRLGRLEWDLTATNNLVPTPLPASAPHPHACSHLSHIVCGRSLERRCGRRAALVYWCTQYWCELISSGNTFGCPTPLLFFCLACTSHSPTPGL